MKPSLYFPKDTLRELEEQARRLDRSISWLVRRAWTLARSEIRTYPSAPDPESTGEGKCRSTQVEE